MNLIDRRKALKLGAAGIAGAGGLLLGAQRSEAGIWVLRDGFMGVFQNFGNWVPYNTNATYMPWDTGGKKLDALIRSFQGTDNWPYNKAESYTVPGKSAKGTRCPDGQCVALVRACTKVGKTADWKRGFNVLDAATTPGPYVPIGSVIARFSKRADGTYYYAGGHTALFAGYRSAGAGGGISVWHMNVEGEFITWRSLPLKGSGFANPKEYYAVVT